MQSNYKTEQRYEEHLFFKTPFHACIETVFRKFRTTYKSNFCHQSVAIFTVV